MFFIILINCIFSRFRKNLSFFSSFWEEFSFEEGALEFSQCTREEGIDFPDPTPGEFGFFAFRDADVDWSSEQVQEAFEICQPENPLENLDD